MKTFTGGMATHLSGSAQTLATCIRLVRTDAQQFAFTSHDRDLVVDAVTYLASPGFTSGAVASNATMAVDNTELTGFFDAAGITEDDLNSGLWDHASFWLFEVNWKDLTHGQIKLLHGTLGTVSSSHLATVELRGMAAALDATVGALVTPACPYSLGDSRCTKNLTDYTTTFSVLTVASNREFDTDLATSTVRLSAAATGFPTDGYFDAGVLTWLTGSNAGRREVVKGYAVDGTVALQLPMFYTVQAGDTGSVHAGCEKTRLAACRDRFDNVIQFGGFDLLPGTEVIYKVGGQQ